MNLDNIKVGQRVPNYRKLCELMEEDIFGGTQKTAQLKRWERFFSWEKAGNAYVIKDIYAIPKESQDGRQKYLLYMEPLILSYLCRNDCYFESSVKNICQEIRIVDPCVYDEEEYRKWLPPVEHYDALEVRRAQLEIREVAKRALMSTLDSLKKRQILTWEKKYFVKPVNSVVRVATCEEVRTIKNIDEATKRELGVTPFKLNINPSLNAKYNKALKMAYQREGWAYVFTQIEVEGINQEVIWKYAELDLTEPERAVRRIICQTAKRQIRDNCERDEKKAEEQGGWVEGFNLGRMRAEAICYLIEELV